MQRRSLLAMTAPQEGLWIAHHCARDTSLYNVAQVVEIAGPLDVPRLLHAIKLSFDACDTFHHRFVPCEDPGLAPAGLERFPQEQLDAVGTSLLNATGLTAQALQTQHWLPDLRTGVDLEREVLFKAVLAQQAPELHTLYIRSHHICVDGLGLSLWLSKVWGYYKGLRDGGEDPRPRPTSIVDALRSWRAYEDSPRKARDAQFWRQTLKTRSAVRYATGEGSTVDHPLASPLTLPEALHQTLRDRCEQNKVPEHAFWIAALSRSVLEQHGDTELSVGIPFANRFGSAVASIPCMWMNLLPLRVQSSPGQNLLDQAQDIAATMQRYARYRHYRHEWMRRDLRALQGHPDLFGPVINPITLPPSAKVPELRIDSRRLSGGPVQDLTLTWIKQGQARAAIEMELPARLASPALFERWSQRIITTLERALHRSVPTRSGSTPPASPGLLDTIQAHVQAQPEQAAIECRQSCLSYQELWDAASGLASQLEHSNGPVILWLERGARAIVAMLACLIARRAYAPVDPQGPWGRNLEILTALEPGVILCDQKPHHALVSLGVPIHDLRGPSTLDEGSPARSVDPHPVAYWMHTSGSTGKPRAVAIGVPALDAFIQAATTRYGWTPRDRVLQFAPLAFDASVEEIFGALYCGATLVVRADADTASISNFITSIRRRRITVVDLPTAFWHEWVFAAKDEDLGMGIPASLRQVIIGGEAVLEAQVQRWRAMAPIEVELLNTYGPTETTVVVTAASLHGAPDQAYPPTIGEPLPGMEIFVLDAQGHPVVPGEAGEIAVASNTVSLGYADCPTQNQKVFVAAPKASGFARMYKTGDRGHFDANGQLHYLGRIDEEIKISGFRIHPGEVEAALLKHPEISAAVVLVHKPSSGSAYLAAHIQSRSESLARNLEDFRADLSQQLIASAVPRTITIHASLPKTASGKINRKALLDSPEPSIDEAKPEQDALTDLEQKVAKLWQELLHVPVRSKTCDFFELGGESLHCLQLATRLSNALDRPLDANLFIQHPTLGELCEALSQGSFASAQETQVLAKERMHQDLEQIGASIPSVNPNLSSSPGTTPLSVLITGATGFIGAAVLDDLLQIPGLKLTALARNPSAAQQTLESKAKHSAGARIRWLQGDLEQAQLGLSEREWAKLAEHTQVILHCAGNVSLLHDYAYCRPSNVTGCATLLELMSQGPAKRMLSLSTLAVAPGPAHAEQIPEARVPWHIGLHNGYTQSKWVGEQAVALAHDRGHGCTALRIGRAYASRPNIRDLLTRVVAACTRLGAWPILDIRESWISTPEICAITRAFVHSQKRWPSVLNASDGQNYSWNSLFAELKQKDDETLPLDLWLSRLQDSERLEDKALAGLLEPLLSQDLQGPYIGLPPAQNEFLRAYCNTVSIQDRYQTLRGV